MHKKAATEQKWNENGFESEISTTVVELSYKAMESAREEGRGTVAATVDVGAIATSSTAFQTLGTLDRGSGDCVARDGVLDMTGEETRRDAGKR